MKRLSFPMYCSCSILILVICSCYGGKQTNSPKYYHVGTDFIEDQCPNDPNKTEPEFCGCNVPADCSVGYNQRIVALGDIHGDYSALIEALTLAEVIDETLNWIGENTLLVQTGDIIDRGDDERQIIDYLLDLKSQAKSNGGDVFQVMGNHELMNLTGDYRYVTYGSCAAFQDIQGLNLDQPELNGVSESCRHRAAALLPGGPYGNILAEYPAAIVVGKSVFVHGGILPEHLENQNLEAINAALESWARGQGGDYSTAYELMWDRIYSKEAILSDETCTSLVNVLETLGVDRMVMGHSVQGRINAQCNGKAWRIDVGMSEHYQGPIEVLEIIGHEVRVIP